MAITAPTKIGEGTGTTSTTCVITTSVAHSAGEPIAVHFLYSSSLKTASVTDSAGNSYSQSKRTASGASIVIEDWISNGANALASGQTVTITFTGSVSSCAQAIKSGNHSTTKDNEATATNTTGTPSVNFTSVGDPVLLYAATALAITPGSTAFSDGWSNYGALSHPTLNLRLIVQSLIKTPAGAGTYADIASLATVMTRWVTNVVGYAETVPPSGVKLLTMMDCGR